MLWQKDSHTAVDRHCATDAVMAGNNAAHTCLIMRVCTKYSVEAGRQTSVLQTTDA